MSSSKERSEESLRTIRPPMLVNNPRERIEAEQIPVEDLVMREKEGHFATQFVPHPVKLPALVPIPKFPVVTTWTPNDLYFVMDEEPVTVRLRIWNISNHSMYFLVCGLWGDMARHGAGWCCRPRTRIWLPPGLSSEVVVKATPRERALIPCATARMQLAAGHLRDNVTGYFSIFLLIGKITPKRTEGYGRPTWIIASNQST